MKTECYTELVTLYESQGFFLFCFSSLTICFSHITHNSQQMVSSYSFYFYAGINVDISHIIFNCRVELSDSGQFLHVKKSVYMCDGGSMCLQ